MCYHGIAHVPTGRLKPWDPENAFPPGVSCATRTSSSTPMNTQYNVNEPCLSIFGPQACPNVTAQIVNSWVGINSCHRCYGSHEVDQA